HAAAVLRFVSFALIQALVVIARVGHRLLRASARGPAAVTRVSDPHGLDVHELAQSVDSELATVAGMLHATERQAWIGRDHAVHEDESGLDLVDEPRALVGVGRPHASAGP